MHLKNELMILQKNHLDYAKSVHLFTCGFQGQGQSGTVFYIYLLSDGALLPSLRALQATPLAGLPPDTPAAGPAPWPHPPTAPMVAYLQGKAISTVKTLKHPHVSSS